MKPFRERNPVVVGAISIAVLAIALVAAFRAQDLPLIGGGDTYYANFSEAGGINDVGFGNATMNNTLVQSGERDFVLNLAKRFAEEVDSTVTRTSSPYDVVQAFEGLADTAGDINTDQLAQSLTTLADLSRNTPEEFQGALEGVSALSSNVAAKNDEINSLLKNLRRVSTVLDDRDQDIIELMEDSDVLFRALVARRDAVHRLLVSTTQLSQELTALVRDTRADLKPALESLEEVLDVLNKNEDNIDDSIRLMAPFYRVFANTLGSGPWFDTYIQNFPLAPLPDLTNGGGIG